MSNTDKKVARILAVDDDEPVREVMKRVLGPAGYEVTTASDGAEALACLEKGDGFDLVVADLEMPELRGADMADRIRAARPDQKILYVSGCVDSLLDERQLWEGEAFLEKPFTFKGLTEAVSLLLFDTLAPPSPDSNTKSRMRRIWDDGLA